MAKSKNSVDGTVNKLAEIADKLQELHQGKTMVVFEMDQDQYDAATKAMKVKDSNRFTIDISGTDFIFLLTEDE
jgi:KaiC/GvpD/RAD55 family RecA-like ATPase